MENDVLKNKIAPWQEKGRWYHGLIDMSSDSFIAEKTDKFIVDNFGLGMAAQLRVFRANDNPNLKILDLKTIFHGATFDSTQIMSTFEYVYTDGKIGKYIYPYASGTRTGICEFWVFIVNEA